MVPVLYDKERRSIGGRVPVLLKLDGSRPSFHIWYSSLRYRTVSIITLTLASSSSRFTTRLRWLDIQKQATAGVLIISRWGGAALPQ
ncbi:Uncharacterized protein HZ326_25376 [Fusarium oxysporum f. sp. albedinis]|nr:Uncharacterized protein HZ326_25376 [Fusarium oxysporum f. sp. albedinis]